MKKILPLFFLACFCNAQAQDSTIVVKAGTGLMESLSITDIYEYPQFLFGKVSYRNGDSAAGRLNYNKLTDEIQFIDPKGDTLDLADPEIVNFIRINEGLYFYNKGYVKILKDNKTIKLAAKQTLRITDRIKIGAYDMPSPSSAIDAYSKLAAERRLLTLVPREDVILKRHTQYFFGDQFHHYVLANKKNTLNMFPKQSRTIVGYLKENHIDFDKREDIEKLFQYLSNL